MVEVEQRPLENIASIRIPMQRNHISEIVGANVDAPAVPIEKSNVVTTILRQKAIPVVCVSLHECHMMVRVAAQWWDESRLAITGRSHLRAGHRQLAAFDAVVSRFLGVCADLVPS